jgi:pimeloyl-ACP methyl ester carboxylesterase
MRGPERRHLALPERGLTLALVDWGGEGPLLLHSHANGFCADLFGPVAEQLTQRFRVIGYDSRGHGDSDLPKGEHAFAWNEFALDMVAVARALLAELGLEQVALGVGHSYAGTCMLASAAREPALFGHVAMLDPVMYPPQSEWSSYPVSARGASPMADAARKRRTVFDSRNAARARWNARRTFGDWDPRALDLYLERGFRARPDGRVELKCAGETEAAVYDEGPAFELFQEAAGLRTPSTLFFAARGDREPRLALKLVEQAPSVKLVELDASHLLLMIIPDRIARLLLEIEIG